MYIVLHNPKATMFADTGTGVVCASHTVPVKVAKMTKRMSEAIKGGAIREVSEDDALAMFKKAGVKVEETTTENKDSGGEEESTEKKLGRMNNEALLAYYKENFSVEPEDEAAFVALTKKAKVAFLLEDE